MLVRRVVAACAVLGLAGLGLVGCDDGPPPATVGKPGATTAADTSGSPYPTYVALRDSYTAAPGVPDTDASTDCLRSNGNYPNLVGPALHATFVDVTCSGATTQSLAGGQKTRQHSYPPQFDALQNDTSLVSLGIGGNDFGLFQSLVADCSKVRSTDPGGAPCQGYSV